MAANVFDFTLEQGTTYQKSFNWIDAGGNPIALTGYTAIAHIRTADYPLTTLVLTSDPGGGLVLEPGGVVGQVQMTITAEQTTAMSWDGTMPWDLFVTSADGSFTTRLLEGNVTFSRAVALP